MWKTPPPLMQRRKWNWNSFPRSFSKFSLSRHFSARCYMPAVMTKVFSKVLVVILISFVKCKIPVDLLTVCALFAGNDSFSISVERQIGFLKVITFHVEIYWKGWSTSRKITGNLTKAFMLYFISRGLSPPTRHTNIHLFSLILSHKD